MKIKKILSLVLAIAVSACIFIMPANATETQVDEHIEIIIENKNISEETKEKAIDFYTNGEKECIATYGLTCTLFGHNLESTAVYKITHEARTTSPRCLKKTYNYSACTRCDYESSTLIGSEYIVCC